MLRESTHLQNKSCLLIPVVPTVQLWRAAHYPRTEWSVDSWCRHSQCATDHHWLCDLKKNTSVNSLQHSKGYLLRPSSCRRGGCEGFLPMHSGSSECDIVSSRTWSFSIIFPWVFATLLFLYKLPTLPPKPQISFQHSYCHSAETWESHRTPPSSLWARKQISFFQRESCCTFYHSVEVNVQMRRNFSNLSFFVFAHYCKQILQVHCCQETVLN